MEQIELKSGQTYAELLASNYVGAMSRNDWNGELISLRNTDFEMLAIATLQSTQQLDDELTGKGILFARS